MTTDRTEEGVRVRVKAGIRAAGRTGTALYGPYKRVGETWPGFGHRDDGWTLPVLLDGDDGPCLYSPSELEPGPRRPVPALGSRQVKHRERQETGTLLESLVFGGITWPGLDRAGNLMVPVRLDDGRHRIWRATDIERAPEPEPRQGPSTLPVEALPPGPRVMVRSGGWPASRLGRVMYRWAGAREESRIWPNFADGKWLVPVRMDLSQSALLVPATDLEPFTEPEPVEADRLANTIQAKALRDVAGAAADALELFASRLRDIELDGGER